MGLDRLKVVLARLLPENNPAFVFTVAGTNGKGTTTAALSSLAMQAGKNVGWYSSPHLIHFNERVRINGEEVSDALLAQAFAAVELARADVSLSYFEYTTLAAFWCFAEQQVDVWVLEVGLGGRLDAVNAIEPDVSIITNIGLDHQGFLGDTLEQIGYEKAGICRANKPLVLASDALPESVLETAQQKQAEVYRFGSQHGLRADEIYWQGGSIDAQVASIPKTNAAAALQAFALSPFKSLSASEFKAAFANIELKGRMQGLSYKGCEVIADVGHNPHAAAYIASQLVGEKVHFIIGMLADKDPAKFIAQLKPIAASINLIGLDVPRGLAANELAERLIGCDVTQFASLQQALDHFAQAGDGQRLFIGGSFYTVCEALRLLES